MQIQMYILGYATNNKKYFQFYVFNVHIHKLEKWFFKIWLEKDVDSTYCELFKRLFFYEKRWYKKSAKIK